MSAHWSTPRAATPSVLAVLLPIIAVVFIAFLVIGLAMPVLPLHVHQGLGLGTFVVGLVAGAQFGASLLSRFWAGEYADTRGARIALVCVLIEAAGQALIWLAPGPALALLGAAVTGFGYSLVYPGFGVEAVHRAPPQSRGLAMGAYTACLDLALGLANPALGLVASGAGLGRVYLVSTLVVLCATAIAVRLLNAQSLYMARRSENYQQ